MKRFDKHIKKLLGEEELTLVPLPGGVNSHLYIASSSQEDYFIKQYKKSLGDTRNRLKTEFEGLTFLRKHNITCVPEPLARLSGHNVGIYSFVRGKPVIQRSLTTKDLDQVIEFVRELYSLGQRKEARRLPDASEASFRMQAYIDSVEKRITRLLSHSKDHKLHRFISSWLRPAYKEVKEFVKQEYAKYRLSLGTQLALRDRILSPSDFGFHNALRERDGSLVFVDFEYFGWDDPAKLIADFFLHPAMKLSKKHKDYFLRHVYRVFRSDRTLSIRLPLVYRILAFKWCTIMLNVFLKQDVEKGIKDRQLRKANTALSAIIRQHEKGILPFSYINI